MAKVYSNAEIAAMLLQIIDEIETPNFFSTGIQDREYIGQGIHKLYLDRDVLVRESEWNQR